MPAEFKTLCAERRVEMRDNDSLRVDLTLASDGIELSFRWLPISCGTPRRGCFAVDTQGCYTRAFPIPLGFLLSIPERH